MENSIYISLSRMMSLRNKMDAVANNVANSGSTGFKQQRVLFSEVLRKTSMTEKVSLVHDRAMVRDMSEGPLSATTNPLDLALRGKGFFVVDTLNGPHYTRAGRFQLNATNQIVDDDGLPVLDRGNRPITLPGGTTDIRIAADGSVFSNASPAAPVGQINVVSFNNEQQMKETGGGLFITDEKPQAAPKDTRVIQGSIEESNVKPVVEITNMIDILRQYQGIQKVIDAEHDRQKTMIQKLGRTA
ncbi:MAG: flagellar basal-body rod protein FlgF [Rhodospirillaceae bacterium]